jgi:phage FluMu protein Com
MKSIECEHCGSPLIPELMQCPHCGEPAGHPIPTDIRCECGFLLCKLTEDAIEIKCRRCKRVVQLPLFDLPQVYQNRKEQEKERPRRVFERSRQPDPRGQYCTSCGQFKPSVLYGKCIDCRTESIKVQYKSKFR